MALFQYRAADHSGKLVEGSMEADGERGVVSRLHEMGFIPVRVAAPGEWTGPAGGASIGILFRRHVSPQELLNFTRELATLLGAGLPLDRSLSVLANLVPREEFRKTVRALLEAVRAGKSLSAAMTEHPATFPRLYANMVRAGESAGILEGTLRHLEEYLERSINLREDLKSALTYPVLVATVAGLSLIVLFIYVIPKFAVVFRDIHQALPWFTTVLIGFSVGLSRFGWVVLLAVAVAGAAVFYYIRTAEGKFQWDRLRLRVWVLGDLFRRLEVARFARTLAALLKGGVPLLEALGTVQGVVGNRVLELAISQVQKRVKEGKGMVGPLMESGLFPSLALQMIAVGEETGKLEGMLVDVADYYDLEVRRTTKRLMSLLEPALILGMGLVVGVVVISMLMAIFSINDLPL